MRLTAYLFGSIRRRKILIRNTAVGVLLVFLFVVAACLCLIPLGHYEMILWEFEGTLIPALREHLQTMGLYDHERLKQSRIGGYAMVREIPPETSCTIYESTTGIMVMMEEPNDEAIPILWYGKETGEYSRLIVQPWR